MGRSLPSHFVESIFRDLQSDVHSGATEIAQKAAKCLESFSEQAAAYHEDYGNDLVKLGRVLIDAQPTMAPLFNLVNHVLLETESARRTGPVEEIQRALSRALSQFQHSTQTALEAIARHAQGLITPHSTVMTHSSSKTVMGVLRQASLECKSIRTFVTESRPFCEGRELARALGQWSIPTQVVLDAAVAQYVKRSDLVIVGVDRVAEESFINKVGTLSLAMACQNEQVPFYIACERNKLLPAALLPIGEILKSSEQQVQEEWMNVELLYSLFEEIPNRWLSGVITEEGVMGPTSLGKYFKAYRISSDLERHLQPDLSAA